MSATPATREGGPLPEAAPEISNERDQSTVSNGCLQQQISGGKPITLDAIEPQAAGDYFHAPTETFLVRNDAGRWLPLRQASFKRLLVARGLNGKAGKGEALAETDLEILRVQLENDVGRFGPLCGRNSGFYEADGCRVLVTEDMRLIEPAVGDHATIQAVLKGLLADSENRDVARAQLHAFLGWLQSSVAALRAGQYQQQQAIAICGPKDCGKSFVQHHIVTPCLAGRSVDAERYFLRGNDFNGDLFGAEHLSLDDCQASTAIRDRLQFAAKLKGCTVGASVKSCHAKGRDAVTLRPWWRISITLNDDPENLLVLPPLNDDFADKLMLLRASRFTFPEPVGTSIERARFVSKLNSEIPAFLYWLLNTYKIPEEFTDPRRYNIATYHHPDLKENLESLSPERDLLDLIDETLAEELQTGPVWITADELEIRIRARFPHRAEKILFYRQACGKYLQRLSQKHPARVMKSRTASQRGWLISLKNDGCDG